MNWIALVLFLAVAYLVIDKVRNGKVMEKLRERDGTLSHVNQQLKVEPGAIRDATIDALKTLKRRKTRSPE